MLTDADDSPWADREELLGRLMSRAEALESSLKQEVFDILDAVGAEDTRLDGWWLDSRTEDGGES